MIKPFNGQYPITQNFNDPCCRESYYKYGLKGHNGIDYGLPCETKLISPINGTVTQVADEGSAGYGKYVKIENSAEACLLAHLSKQDVQIGQKVDAGQHIGWSGTTGNSTGCHLHFGYHLFLRDRNNGFNGYIDPAPYFSDIIQPPNTSMNDQTKISGSLLGTTEDLEIQQIRGLLNDGKRDAEDLRNCRIANDQQAVLINNLQKDLNTCLTKPPDAPFSPKSPLGKLALRLAYLLG